MDANAIVEALRSAVPTAHIDLAASIDMPVIVVDRDSWHDVARALHDDPSLNFQFLSDVVGTDQHPREPRFEVVYLMAALDVPGLRARPAESMRLRVRVPVPASGQGEAHIATVSDIWPSASWPEREVFDMFGIIFDQHPDLRRVLMPEDWEGYPLRKDYPVQIKRAVKIYAPLQLSAEEFASNIDRIRRTSQQTGNEGVGREEEGEVGQRFAEPPTRKTDEKFERE
jgi:NADH-quinone oxidoreductase subunit C